MKHRFFLIFVLLLICSGLSSQAPRGFTYQAVARNISGDIIPNQDVSFRISLLQGNIDGVSVYKEEHFVTTNAFGLVILTIGQGLNPQGNFSLINWGAGPYFLMVEFDANGKNDFSLMGTNELLSVPYALYAETSGSVSIAVPEVITEEPLNVTAKEAKLSGKVINDGGEVILLKGFCWSTSSPPTTSDTIAGNGVGKGDITTELSGLDDAVTYYVRAFATNRAGTGYGNEMSFTTLPLTGTVTDIDGNTYPTIMIGSQMWMAENLRTTRYNNEVEIAGNLSNAQWSAATFGAYSYPYGNPEWDDAYGKLYNWFAVTDTNGLCPQGWKIPEDEDWADLLTYLGGSLVAGGKMKSTRTAPEPHPRWELPNAEATNESGFNAYPGGDRFTNGLYYNFGRIGAFWTSTEANIANAWSRGLSYATPSVARNSYDQRNGFSVRCIKIMEE